ncbi:MAG TPA: tetratricopeptide repeat protein [Cyclobacteriaceae bacterium]|nr:tetratricopeptide repeat protein [Cyclobacteriaceae bacterium]
MLRTRIILIAITATIVALIFFLPKVVVQNESELASTTTSSDSTRAAANPAAHGTVSESDQATINTLRKQFSLSGGNEKSSIFADSLWNLYSKTGRYDSAAWFAEKSASFLKTTDSYLRAGNSYYEAYSYALEQDKQNQMGAKAREYLGKALEADPKLYEAKAKMAMTFMTSGAPPMQGIRMLREVAEEDPKNEFALFSLGMLSIQSRQYPKAVEWLTKLVEVNPQHLQGQVFLGLALAEAGQKEKARAQFEKAKKMTTDQSVIATIDSYLKDLK